MIEHILPGDWFVWPPPQDDLLRVLYLELIDGEVQVEYLEHYEGNRLNMPLDWLLRGARPAEPHEIPDDAPDINVGDTLRQLFIGRAEVRFAQ